MFIAMNVILLGFFLSLINRTTNFEKRVVKRSFYRRFRMIFSLWFLQLPIFVLVAETIPFYYRAKVLFGLERCIQLSAFLLLPILSQPKRTFETYSVSDNYDARIPARQAQQRVIPMHQRGILQIPRQQLSGQLPGGLPPVNHNMSNSLSQAESRWQDEIAYRSYGNTAHATAYDAASQQGYHATHGGEGIIE